MQPWAVEHGTLWVWETGNGLPSIHQTRIEGAFEEARPADIDELTRAMNLPTPDLIHERLQGNRRCFILKYEDRIVTYGWVTRGIEQVGELEREFHLYDNEAYIWDCGTIAQFRGQGLYSALLSQLIYHLHVEGVPRIWIGASRQNQPSIRGIVNAGFKLVVDCTYRRFYRLTLLRIDAAASAKRALVAEAYRVMLNGHEWRIGPLAFGYKSH